MERFCGEETILDARLSKFLDAMMPTKLFWRKKECKYSYEKEQWVFWIQEASTNWAFQERIITALCSFSEYLPGDALIQFWVAEMIGERCHLTTTLQPFFTNNSMNEKIIGYRKICFGFNLLVAGDVEGENFMDGNLGRVYRNQLPEVSSDLSYNSVTDYPQLELALSCGFKSNLAMPVFDPSQQCCVGVLELLSTSDLSYSGICDLVSKVNGMLQNARMETINAQQIRTQIQYAYKGNVENEIRAALRKVRTRYELISACVWVRCTRIRSVDHDSVYALSYNDYCVNCEGELLFLIPDMSLCGDKNICHYCHASAAIPLNVGQGLVGKAILYRKPFLCRDVSQLSITQYPLVHSARGSGLKGCFAVCLRTNSSGNHEYVVEFFLPRNETYVGNHLTFLSSILTTMKHHLTTFEVVTQDLGNQLFIEVDKFSFHKEFESFKEFPTFNTQLEFEALQNREGMESHYSIDHQLDKRHEITISSERVSPEMQSKEQNLEKKSSCSRKDIEQQFGKKLKDAAEILGVSRSTLKRWCREQKINRWPSYKRSKVCSSSSTPKQTNVVSRGNVETTSQASARDPLCSEPATNVALMPTSSTITIKVPYGNVIIVFKLSYSSTMAELVENVIKRTRLAEGTFSIAYLDEEDDPILLACDEDFQNCLDSLRLSGKTTIRMQIEPIVNKSHLNPVRSKTRFSTSSNFIDQFPSHMHDYIENITDVSGDGHCGFRAIAGVLGLSTEVWGSVRALLWKELNNHQELYTKVLIEHGRVEKMLASLKFFNIPAPKEYWFDLPDMGYLVASLYNVALVCLNKQMSFTYLPLRTKRPKNPKLISIGYVNNDHYVQLMLRENAPLPPIPANWYSHRHSCAVAWLDYYSGRLEMYKLMSGN